MGRLTPQDLAKYRRHLCRRYGVHASSCVPVPHSRGPGYLGVWRWGGEGPERGRIIMSRVKARTMCRPIARRHEGALRVSGTWKTEIRCWQRRPWEVELTGQVEI